MTGPEHYTEAERLLSLAKSGVGNLTEPVTTTWEPADALAAAQVHATLALAAATAEGLHIAELPNDSELPYVRREGSPWGKVLAP